MSHVQKIIRTHAKNVGTYLRKKKNNTEYLQQNVVRNALGIRAEKSSSIARREKNEFIGKTRIVSVADDIAR